MAGYTWELSLHHWNGLFFLSMTGALKYWSSWLNAEMPVDLLDVDAATCSNTSQTELTSLLELVSVVLWCCSAGSCGSASVEASLTIILVICCTELWFKKGIFLNLGSRRVAIAMNPFSSRFLNLVAICEISFSHNPVQMPAESDVITFCNPRAMGMILEAETYFSGYRSVVTDSNGWRTSIIFSIKGFLSEDNTRSFLSWRHSAVWTASFCSIYLSIM